MTEEIKKKIKQIIEDGVYTDWRYNGEDEVSFDYLDKEQILRDVVSLIEETYENVL